MNMPMRTIVLPVALAALTSLAHATEYRFVSENNDFATRFCVAAAKDDMAGLRREMRKMRQSPHHQYSSLVNNTRCNGQPAAVFAHRYGASDTFSYLYRLTSKDQQAQVPETAVEEVTDAADGEETSEVVVVHVNGR